MNELLKSRLELNELVLNESQVNQVCKFIELLQKWSAHFNLTAHRDVETIIEKDIIDILYLLQLIEKQIALSHWGEGCPPKVGRVRGSSLIDLGCGAGFLGILCCIVWPEMKIAFLDMSRKKTNFVRQVIRELKFANCRVLNKKVEDIDLADRNTFNYAASRATWSIIEFLKHAQNYVQNSAHVYLMQGKQAIITSVQILNDLGYELVSEDFYKILPKSYERKIFCFKNLKTSST